VASVQALPEVLCELGVDPAPVLESAGIDVGLFDDPDNVMSFAARGRLVQTCVERTGCKHFGLLVGARNGVHSLGLLGLLMKYAPTVDHALQALVKYLYLHGRGGMNSLSVTNQRAILGFEVYMPGNVATDQIGDGAVMFMFNILRQLCGTAWQPQEAWFARRRPSDVKAYQQLLSIPLRFNAEKNAVVFDVDDLARPIPNFDADLYRYLQQQVDLLDSMQTDDLPRQVRMALRSAFSERRFSSEHVASLFAMHARTLNRRLNLSGTSFRVLVEETRYEMACQMLEHSDMDLRQIGLALGYADPGSFVRAFRRWSGMTPGQWRIRGQRPAVR
jgi:AraC-like DNA-binding protein